MMIQAAYPSLINSNNFLSLPQHIGTIKTEKVWISNKKETTNINTNAIANTISNNNDNNNNNNDHDQGIIHISYDITNPTVKELYKLIDQLNLIISEITKNNNDNDNDNDKYDIESIYKLNLLIATYCKNLLLSSNSNSTITSLSQVLKIWEIRLNCMLLLSSKPITTLLTQSDSTNTDSSILNSDVATRFPISSTAQQQQQQQQQPAFASMNSSLDQNHIIISSAKMLKTEVNILLKELDVINKTRLEKKQQSQQTLQQANYTSVAPKYPDELEWDFKLLLNRIRHGSSLILVNYYFLEVFDLRSNIGLLQSSIKTAGSNNIENEIKNKIKFQNDKLINLTYSVLSVMISKQELLTCFNLLIEIIEKDELSNKLNKLNKFKILLLLILIGLIMIIKEIGIDKIENINKNAYFPIINKFFKEFTKKESNEIINYRELVIEMLIQVLSKIEPIYNDLNSKPIDVKFLKNLKENFNLNELIKLCSEFKISGRILCCLCGKFEITNKLNNIEEKDTKECEDYNECLTVLNKEWNYNINNYYAIE
ncbi:hypothetical protein B5S32_g2768 [[Candida] boidinii]|nr:hypothetical protein B5S32_g2768 [[Candida] boidinii]